MTKQLTFTTVLELIDEAGAKLPPYLRNFSYEDECRFIQNWCKKHNAHYHGWHGESYLRRAEEQRAANAAVAAGKSIIVMDYLS